MTAGAGSDRAPGSERLRAVFVEDRPDDVEMMLFELRRAGFAVEWERVETEDALAAALTAGVDVVFADYSLPRMSATRALELVQRHAPGTPVIVVTGTLSEDAAAAMTRLGAGDYLLKDRPGRLPLAVKRLLEHRNLMSSEARALRALADSEHRFRLIADSVPDMVFRLAVDPISFEYVSRAIAEFSGHTAEEHLSDPTLWRSLVHADDLTTWEEAVAAPVPSEHVVVRWTRPDGEIVWAENRLSPVRDQDGTLIAVEGIARDVTTRKAADSATFERAVHIAFESAVIHALTSTEELRPALAACAESFVEFLGAAAARIWMLDERTGTLNLEATAGLAAGRGDAPALHELGSVAMRTIAESGEPLLSSAAASDVRVADGAWIAREEIRSFAGYPLVSHGKVLGVVAMFGRRDLSEGVIQTLASVANTLALGIEHKRAQAALRVANHEKQLILDSISDGIVGVDNDGTITFVNVAAAAMLRAHQRDLVGRSAQATIHHSRPDGSPFAASACGSLEATLTGASITSEDDVVWTSDGEPVLVEFRSSPVRDGDRILGAVATYRDISERVRAHRDRVAMEARLHQAERLESLGRLAGGVAHDFNNLLAVIQASVELASLSGCAEEKCARELDEIARAAQAAISLTRRLLLFSRPEALTPAHLDLAEVVEDAHGLLARALGEQVSLRLSVSPEPMNIFVDGFAIQQALVNIAANARDSMPDGGKLEIVANRAAPADLHGSPELGEGEWVALRVTDQGSGMPPHVMERALDPFFTTKARGRGTGLGLASVYATVKHAGGVLKLESKEGVGTTVEIFLPLVGAAGAKDAGLPPAPAASLTGVNVLLVEDEQQVRAAIRRMLEHLGCSVLEAPSPIAALALVSGGACVDSILTDVVMPRMSGPQLVAAVRPSLPDAAAVYMSGYPVTDMPQDHVDGILLDKPFSSAQLATALAAALSGRTNDRRDN